MRIGYTTRDLKDDAVVGISAGLLRECLEFRLGLDEVSTMLRKRSENRDAVGGR